MITKFYSRVLKLLFLWRFDPIAVHDLSLQGFAITLRHTTLGRTPLDE
jgi:hypothetical protein